jgi:hypothetical protein
LVKIPSDFRRVISIEEDKNGIIMTDENRLKVRAEIELNFVKSN